MACQVGVGCLDIPIFTLPVSACPVAWPSEDCRERSPDREKLQQMPKVIRRAAL